MIVLSLNNTWLYSYKKTALPEQSCLTQINSPGFVLRQDGTSELSIWLNEHYFTRTPQSCQ